MGRVADALQRSGQLHRGGANPADVLLEFSTEAGQRPDAGCQMPEAGEQASGFRLEASDKGSGFRLQESGPDRVRSADRPAASPHAVSPGVERPFAPANPRLVGQLGSPLVEEEYRTLGATLHRASERSGIRSVVVTSALPQEGKTLSVANVALTLSRSYGRRVLAIDADLRKPGLHQLFGIPRGPGLCDALASGAIVPAVQVQPRLWVMPAGEAQADSANVLASEGMRRLLAEARREFDWVVIDTPPAGVLPDAQLLVALADAALLVVHAGKTPYDICRRAAAAVSEGGKLLGVLMTHGVARRTAGYYAGYGNHNRPPRR